MKYFYARYAISLNMIPKGNEIHNLLITSMLFYSKRSTTSVCKNFWRLTKLFDCQTSASLDIMSCCRTFVPKSVQPIWSSSIDIWIPFYSRRTKWPARSELFVRYLKNLTWLVSPTSIVYTGPHAESMLKQNWLPTNKDCEIVVEFYYISVVV